MWSLFYKSPCSGVNFIVTTVTVPSDKENVNNIETVHLHFGLQLIFDESQKECNSEIWIDVYDLVRLLSSHRASYQKKDGKWTRLYPFRDMDIAEFPR